MDAKWQHRDYRSGDETTILDLFQRTFGRRMDLKLWQWYFIENPFGHGIIKLLFDEEKLIGHYAVIPMDLNIGGVAIKAVLSMTTMTHPDYGGQGIFTFLAERTYETAAQNGFALVFGFPNKNSYHGFTKKLNWHDLGQIKIFRAISKPSQPEYIGLKLEEISEFDSGANQLWENVGDNYGITVPRTKDFLNWRFFKNPNARYVKFVLKEDGGKILGYVVLKTYRPETGLVQGHIADILSFPHENIAEMLIEKSLSYFYEAGVRDVSCWLPENSLYGNVLKDFGASLEKTETNFGARIFGREPTISDSLVKDIDNWYLTMGNSDVF